MTRLEQELLYEIDWRTNELSIIRTIPILCNCNDEQIKVLERYSVVAIYSVWEGFVVKSFNLYIREINSLNLTYNDLNLNILTHDIFTKYDLTEEQKKHFTNKCRFISNIIEYSKLPVNISSSIPTESNVNFEVINQILKHFYLDELSEKEFKPGLKKLLYYRNNIAHGECSLVVDKELIQYFTSTVINAMHEVTTRIIDGFNNKKYLNGT